MTSGNGLKNENVFSGFVSRTTLDKWIESYAARDGECLVWKGAVCNNNQPKARLDGKNSTSVRRYIWACCHPRSKGSILNYGMVARVNCQTPLCVNPDHVVLVKRSQIMAGCKMNPAVVAKRAKILREMRVGHQIADQVLHDRGNGFTYRQLVEKYGVAQGTIYRILKPKHNIAVNSSVFTFRP